MAVYDSRHFVGTGRANAPTPFALLNPIVAPAAAGLVKALEGGCQTAERVLEIVAEQDGKRQGVAGDGRAAPFAAPRENFAEAAFDLVFDDALEDTLGHGMTGKDHRRNDGRCQVKSTTVGQVEKS